MRGWFCYVQQQNVVRRRIKHATTLPRRTNLTQSDLSPGSNDRKHFRFLQQDHEFGYRSDV